MRLFVLPLLFSFDGFILAERLSQYYHSNYSLIQSNSIQFNPINPLPVRTQIAGS
jgi:hypothetical protein